MKWFTWAWWWHIRSCPEPVCRRYRWWGAGMMVGFIAWPVLVAWGFLRAVRAERDQTDVF